MMPALTSARIVSADDDAGRVTGNLVVGAMGV